MEPVSFTKMHGLGNDFVIVDARSRAVPLSGGAIRAIADRRRGIGCDQVIRLEPGHAGDVFMRIWNPDGGEAEACGNGTRCVARLLMEESGAEGIRIETVSGVLASRRLAQGAVDVDMGLPRTRWQDIPLAAPADPAALDLGPPAPAPAVCVNVGNPHAVLFVDDCEAVDLEATGPRLEHSPWFPRRANISFATVRSASRIDARVWERGAGATSACGSAACAVAVAGHIAGRTPRRVTVSLPGGALDLDWRDDGRIHMAGPASTVFRGTLDPELAG